MVWGKTKISTAHSGFGTGPGILKPLLMTYHSQSLASSLPWTAGATPLLGYIMQVWEDPADSHLLNPPTQTKLTLVCCYIAHTTYKYALYTVGPLLLLGFEASPRPGEPHCACI